MRKRGNEPEFKEDKEFRFKSALRYCYKILNYKPYTEHEIGEKVAVKYGEDIVEDILKRLKEERLVNDRLYIKLWVNSRINSHPEGVIIMKYKLKQKGIPANTVEMYFSENPVDEREMIRATIKKKFKHYYGNKGKLYKYLLNKGFGSENITSVLNEI